jgi:hypothetical protein
MLKLAMNRRKGSKRHRSIPHRVRLPDEEDENSDCEKEMLVDNLRAMLRQEISGKYSCADYLRTTACHQNVYQLPKKRPFDQKRPHDYGTNSSIDELCREQIVEWSFRLVDFFRIDREVVAVSLSFLDRFLANCPCDRASFKLAATTTLHLAVKLFYPCKLTGLGILGDLSHGEFDMSDVSKMEAHILHTLAWNLQPPTAIAFSSIFLDYFFSSAIMLHVPVNDLDDICDVSSFFCELAVCDYFFVSLGASGIAMAAILNAFEGMFGPDNNLACDVIRTAQNLGLDACLDLSAARTRLWELYGRSEECGAHNDKIIVEVPHATWPGSIFVKKMFCVSSPILVTKPFRSANDFAYANQGRLLARNESW